MRTLPILVSYDDAGKTVTREKVAVMFASGETDPRHRAICFNLPDDTENKLMVSIYITPAALAKATGLIVREPKRKSKGQRNG